MREGRKEGREEEMCGSSHLVEVFNDECRSQDVGPRPLNREDFRTHHQTMNSSSLAITMFRTPNVQRYGRSKRKNTKQL